MKRLLIVEDEKMIRRGLRAIVSRSNVEIGEILECKNGEEALALLRETHVDVMFTDVRMPRMDGITLIRRIREELEDRPEIVVISGHDDFNYAVEAMRYGCREYILKPVERERVFEVLAKLEKLVEERTEEQGRQGELEKVSRRQLKYMLLNPGITEDEVSTIRNAFADLLDFGSYVVLCLNRPPEAEKEAAYVLESVGAFHILVLPENARQAYVERHLRGHYTGISGPRKDLKDFRAAFEEAVAARKHAFLTCKGVVEAGGISYPEEGEPEQTPQQAARRIGTREYPRLVHFLNGLFVQAERGRLYPQLFENFLLRFFQEAEQQLERWMEPGDEGLPPLKAIYGFDTAESYRMALLDWLDGLHARVHTELESGRNSERIQAAVEYVEQNFGNDLNMAVVSNQVSMNYSVFSQLFKEHTGQNFVDYLRDLRMNKAKELLAYSDQKISEISRQVGYENDKYFMKTFKSAVGVSPTQYRKVEQMKLHGKLL